MGNLGYGAFPTHPGEVLKDEIEARGISQRQLADSVGLTYSVVNEILNGHRALTAKTALMFEAALDVPADTLMYLQMKYNMQTTRNDRSVADILKNIRKVAAVLWNRTESLFRRANLRRLKRGNATQDTRSEGEGEKAEDERIGIQHEIDFFISNLFPVFPATNPTFQGSGWATKWPK